MRKYRLTILIAGLILGACADGGASDDNNNFVVGGGGDDATHIGSFESPAGDGFCDFYPQINVQKNNTQVIVGGKLVCLSTGQDPQTCGFGVEAIQNLNTVYRHTNPRDTCTPGGPVTTNTYRCASASCTGDWTGEGGVYVKGPPGSVWTAAPGCQASGNIVDCSDLRWPGDYVA